MSQEHIEQLEKARKRLVEARHNLAGSIANNSGEMGEGLITGIIKIQEAIEAIDRAIEELQDEEDEDEDE
jgi:hypothetical protein